MKKFSITSWFKKSANANKNAKREQLKTVALLMGVILVALGFYFYTRGPLPHRHTKTAHFAGAFDDSVGAQYDHARIEALLTKLDTTDTKLDKLAQKAAHHAPTPSEVESARTDKQLAALQKQINHLSTAVAQAKLNDATQSHTIAVQHNATKALPPHQKVAKVLPPVTKPLINSVGIDDEVMIYPEKTKAASRNANNYVWAGTFVSGYLLTGIIGDAGTNATKNKGTVAIKLTTAGTMPNGQHSHLSGCVVLGSTYGDLSADSDVIHLETLSCAKKHYSFEKKVYGSVFDLDAMQDLRGIPVLKARPILGYATVAGLLSGVGAGISAASSIQSMTGAGVVSTPTSVGRAIAGGALEKPADKITDYLMAIANLYHPIVVARAGRKVTVMFQAGFWIDKSHQQFQSMQSIGAGLSNAPALPSAKADTLTQKVAGASGAAMSQAQAQAESEFNQHHYQLGQALFSPASSSGATYDHTHHAKR